MQGDLEDIVFVGIVVQTTGAFLLAATFLALRRLAGRRGFLRDWSRAFVALLGALLVLAIRYQILLPSTFAGGEQLTATHRALYGLYQFGKLLFFGWLLTGSLRFAGRRPPLSPGLLATGAAIVALASVVAARTLNDVVRWQAPFAVITCAWSSLAFARIERSRRSLGTRATSATFLVLALLWVTYSFCFSVVAAAPAKAPALLVFLSGHNSFVDVAVQTALGFSLVITFFQEIERDAELARAESASLQARLAESQQLEALGLLVSGVAHELNNPLTSILGFSDVLSHEPRLGPELASHSRTIHEQAQRCRTIVRELLDASRTRKATRQPIALPELVERVTRGVAPQLERAGIHVELDVPRDLPRLLGDATGLEQVLANLYANSIDALSDGGTIRVVARADAAAITLDFADDGPGVPVADRARVFEPFFTTKPGPKGPGLGLPISRRIVRAHGGAIDLVEPAPGEHGARFRISLPLTPPPSGDSGFREPPRPHVATPRTPPPGSLRATRLLVVDDEPSVRQLLRRWFGTRGFEVIEAAGGNEALALVEQRPDAIDAIVTDLRMPAGTGMELVETLRARHSPLALRVVAITGDLLSPDVAAFARRRLCPVLEKPLDLERLLDEVALAAARVAG